MPARADVDLTAGTVIVTGEAQALRYVNRIPGAKRKADGAWHIPLTLDTCEELKSQRIPLSPELADCAERLRRIQRYIEQIKVKDGDVTPLQPIPIKAPFHLYQHQVKAYNIALALFGRGARRPGT